MKRRNVLRLIGGAIAAAPVRAYAQPAAMPVVGFLHSQPQASYGLFVAPFREGLASGGYTEGRNVAVEYRWADGNMDRLPALAADLVHKRVSVIAAFGAAQAPRAAMAATKTIPIVFALGGDPVAQGLVSSLNRPAGNVTGATFFTGTLQKKRLELLREVAPRAATVGILYNPTQTNISENLKELDDSAPELGLRLQLVTATTEREIEPALAKLAAAHVQALLVVSHPLFTNRREQVAALAARHRLPAIYAQSEVVEAGGLMSYGASTSDAYRQAGGYVARILKGARPADLPVLQPTKFELVINKKTARAIGLTVPQSVLLRADRVIE